MIGETYEAHMSANVRSGPGTAYPITAGLAEGEPFIAVGQVPDSRWIAVSKGSRMVGYVHASLVSAAPSLPAVSAGNPPALRQGIDLDAIDLDSEGLVADLIESKTQCRTVHYQIDNGEGKANTESFDACRGGDGAWEIL